MKIEHVDNSPVVYIYLEGDDDIVVVSPRGVYLEVLDWPMGAYDSYRQGTRLIQRYKQPDTKDKAVSETYLEDKAVRGVE